MDFTNNLCASVQLNDTTNACSGTVVTGTPSPLTIRYDNVPPAPPTVTITPLDSQLSVRLAPSDPSDTISYFRAQYAVEPADGGTPNYIASGGNVAANNPVVTISGLVNGTNYLVQGFSIDEATNQSAASAAVTGTPVVTLRLLRQLPRLRRPARWRLRRRGRRRALGSGAGECPAARASAEAWVRKALLLFALAAASPALADGDGPRPLPNTTILELKLGFYQPRVYDSPGVTGDPYVQTFGNSPMLIGVAEVDRSLYHGYGYLGIGLSVGYGEKYAKALLADGTPSGEATGLMVLPIRLMGVYRYDVLAHLYHIPLVPYARAGLRLLPLVDEQGRDDGSRQRQQGFGRSLGVGLHRRARPGDGLPQPHLRPRSARGLGHLPLLPLRRIQR